MTSDHLLPVLESERASELLTEVAGLLSVGRVPDAILQAIRLSRFTALQKRDGRDCRRRHHPKIGGSHNGKAHRQEGGSSHGSLPVRPENQGRMRVRRSCLADPGRC